ncbi:hypothetical protein DB41_IB00640 [Neochlamydia sp. TUME1]|uniref:DUF6444 domain-containing protein n=1 Tax=unclassified Neochlamydia TaxID=2643326 RepID=UPI0005838435|nr:MULTISPECIES: DUF6444 domain-containing protein [unclassified Neochlamydia]KIC74931.1 hypothetical protein DB41_IB00640 [Neochlamydia sp. TUME1]BBI16531.1 Uncharacterized protein NCS13_1_0336 [Neochlamydia sp. S13]
MMKPTYEDLFILVQHQSQMVFEQEQTIKRLEKRILELEKMLNLPPINSSKEPSSERKKNRHSPKRGAKP